MALVSDAITYARQKGQTDSNGISDTNGLAWANSGLIDITRELIRRNIDASQIAESNSTITTGIFAWPPDMFMLKTIAVNYADSTAQNFIQATKLDVSNLQESTSVGYVRTNQSTQSPQFTNHGDTGEIFPTPITNANLNIFYYLIPTEYTSTSSTISYPQNLDWRVLGDKILESYYQALERFDISQQWGLQAMKKINDSVQILAPQSQQPIQPQPLHITGWRY